MSSFLVFSNRVYRTLLQAYPRPFRERFEDEMAQVFHSLCAEKYRESGRGGVALLWVLVIQDWARAAVYQWWLSLFRGRMESMNTSSIDVRDGVTPLSAGEAGLAALPFLIYGISNLVDRLDIPGLHSAATPFWRALLIQPYLVCYWLILAGLGIGIALGFPRWAISYLGWSILIAWSWEGVSFNGHTIGGWLWLPLLGVVLIGLLVRRSFQPLRSLGNRLWQEGTVASLAIYILYAWVYMMFDENHHPLLLVFITVTTLAVSLGAWGYFRAGSPLHRILALLAGLLLAVVLNGVSYATWDYRTYYSLPESAGNDNLVGFVFFVVIAVFMIGNGLLARSRMQRSRSQKITSMD